MDRIGNGRADESSLACKLKIIIINFRYAFRRFLVAVATAKRREARRITKITAFAGGNF